MKNLTLRQQEMLGFIQVYLRENGYWPSIREIQSHFDFKSTNAVMGHLRALEKKGYISRIPGQARTFRITYQNDEQKPEGSMGVVSVDLELLGQIDVLLAGRAAEQIIFGDISTGAGNDLTRAADIARRMITDYGMSDKFRNVYLPTRRAGGAYLDDGGLLQRDYAESTQTYVDEETARVIDERYHTVLGVLEGIQQAFNQSQTDGRKISLADLIVLAGG